MNQGSAQKVIPDRVRSQSLQELIKPSELSEEKVYARIEQLEKEILETTNDPDRALALRREVQKLREELGQ